MNHTYKGKPVRTQQGGYMVWMDGQPLSPERSQQLVNHSPDGFMWGYGGSGPAQLAIALLQEEEVERDELFDMAQRFKHGVIASLPMDKPWEMTSEDIQAWLTLTRQEDARRDNS